MNFNDFKYERPNLEELSKKAAHITETLKNASDYQTFKDTFYEFDRLVKYISTQYNIASVRHSINTKDEFYQKEDDFWNEALPQIQQIETDFTKLLLSSPYCSELEKEVPKPFFDMARNALKTFDPIIMEDLILENQLVSKYEQLVASAQIEFDGKTLTLAQLAPYSQSPDRKIRKEATDLAWNFFKEHEAEFDDIYDQLVKVRDKIAKKLGFKNFTELGYLRMNRLDYNQEDVALYREQILKYVVPVANKLYQKQAQRLGLEQLNYYDVNLKFLDGNATPIGSAEEILQEGRNMYHDLSDETAEFIDLMLDSNLMDVLAKPGKRAGGYMTFFFDYNVPFIFSNFNGTSGDVDVLTHEAGHAFQGYLSRHISPSSIHMPTYESCEIHSMSMEFLTWPYMERFFGDKAARYRFSHLASAIEFLPYGVEVDHFQHEVYNNPDMSIEERKALWRKLDQQYRPHLDFSENEFMDKGVWWYKQGHIFASPFYYIDYTLAQICACQFWKRKFVDQDPQTWHDYLEICKVGGTLTFTQIVALANLKSPFVKGALEETIQAMDTYLSNIDDSTL